MAEYTASVGDTVKLQHATILIQDNEVWIVQDADWLDPVGVSMIGGGVNDRGLGKVSFKTNKGGALTPDQAVEVVLIQGKVVGDVNDETGELYIGLNNGAGSEDSNMEDSILLHANGPVFSENFKAGLLAVLGTAALAPPAVATFPNKLVSPDGHLELDVQNADAAGLVLYQDGVPRWSAQLTKL